MSSPAAEPVAREVARAQAFCRVDLAGGTLDIWPLGQLHRGARTINVAVDLEARVELVRRPQGGYRVRDGGRFLAEGSPSDLIGRPETALVGLVLEELEVPACEIRLELDSPPGAGLGGSSALACALVRAARQMVGRPAPDAEVVHVVRDLEARLMGLPTGCQDQWAACVGGVSEIRYPPGGDAVRSLEVDLVALEACLIVAYSGLSHFSAKQNWQVVRGRLDGDPAVSNRLAEIARVAEDLSAALVAGDLAVVGALMAREWSARRLLAEGVSTPEVETLLRAAVESGAWGGKACGAGGGGSVAILAPPHRKVAISAELERHGARVLPARPVGRRAAGEPGQSS